MNCNNSSTVTIKKIVNGGYGLATLDNGKTVFVRHSLPDENVKFKTIDKQARLNFAKVTKLFQINPNRIDPPCPYYSDCGGCNMQHADYTYQCDLKQHILEDLFNRHSSEAVNGLSQKILPILPSEKQFGYRQRIRLKVDNRGVIGFNRFRSHDIINIQQCLLAPDVINNCLTVLIGSDSFDKIAGITDEIDIQQNPADETICVLLHLNRKPRPADSKNARSLAGEIGTTARVFLTGDHFATQGPFCQDKTDSDKMLSVNLSEPVALTLSWEAGGFCQVNIDQNLRLIKLVLELCNPSSSDRILDLYCGMGNFSLPLARAAGFVRGIESQGSSIRSATGNSHINHLANTEFTKGDVLSTCKKIVQTGETFDTVICDPPRQGMVGMAALLAKLSKNKIVYISCDPATLCRDLGDLVNEGFGVKTIQPVDMFPQTHHIETVTLLEKD